MTQDVTLDGVGTVVDNALDNLAVHNNVHGHRRCSDRKDRAWVRPGHRLVAVVPAPANIGVKTAEISAIRVSQKIAKTVSRHAEVVRPTTA